MLVWIDEDNCEDDGRSTEVPKCLYGGGIPQALKREADVSSHGAEARRGRLRLRGGSVVHGISLFLIASSRFMHSYTDAANGAGPLPFLRCTATHGHVDTRDNYRTILR